ncbi:MAG: XRE family transcriptional regulator [Halobacteriovoraceae bacterium]|nr:XRE family transcriptional regulator [Halobacteriovoraceae bacterium]MCB9095543.1 XRE family transcriptional regulator [Halobacteriovoraceae bacterium]
MKTKTYKNINDFGKDLGLSKEQVQIAKLKTKIKKSIQEKAEKIDFSITEIADMSGLARTTVSGIINGSLQSVSMERLLKLAFALDLSVDLKIGKAA